MYAVLSNRLTELPASEAYPREAKKAARKGFEAKACDLALRRVGATRERDLVAMAEGIGKENTSTSGGKREGVGDLGRNIPDDFPGRFHSIPSEI